MTRRKRKKEEDSYKAVALSFGQEISNRLDKLGWTQADLAEIMGLSRGRISQMLSGPNLELATMMRLAEAVGMYLVVDLQDIPKEKRHVG